MAHAHTIPAKRAFFVEVLTPIHGAQLDVLKLVAVAAMLLDHWNTALNGGESGLASLIGRLAFPVFSVVFACNLGNDPIRWKRAAHRLFIAGVLCQPFFTAAFLKAPHIHWYSANILFAFAVVAQSLYWWSLNKLRYRIATLVLLAASIFPLEGPSYGAAGLLFVIVSHACFHITNSAQAKRAAIAWWILLPMVNVFQPIVIGATILFPWLAIELSALLRRRYSAAARFVPSSSFYWIYGGHLAIIAAIVLLS